MFSLMLHAFLWINRRRKINGKFDLVSIAEKQKNREHMATSFHVVLVFKSLLFILPFLYVNAGILDILSGDTPKGIKIQAKHLEALIELHNMTVLHTFARNVQHLMHSVVTNLTVIILATTL